MQKKILNSINEMKGLLQTNYKDFKGIYFYGSQAREDTNIYSDYDLAFIFERKVDRKFRDEIIDLLYGFDLKYDIVVNVKVFSESESDNPTTPFQDNMKNDGIFYGVS